MLFSLLVAFIVSPWLAFIILKNVRHDGQEEEGKGLVRLNEKILGPLIDIRKKRLVAFGVIGGLLLLALALVPLKAVTMKMLPFDNKSELQVIIETPEGRTME